MYLHWVRLGSTCIALIKAGGRVYKLRSRKPHQEFRIVRSGSTQKEGKGKD